MGGPGHHTFQILTHVAISYGAFWKVQFNKNNLDTTEELKEKI
jgi:hypothetical protein